MATVWGAGTSVREAGSVPGPQGGTAAAVSPATPEPRRDWAVVLYSGDCPEHPGILCAMQVISPCTLEETDRVAAAVDHSVPGFVPHRCAVLDPADFLGG